MSTTRILSILFAIALQLGAQLLPLNVSAQTATWKQRQSLGPLPLIKADPVGFSIADSGYLMNNNEFWSYRGASHKWDIIGSLPGFTSSGAVALVIGGRAYVLSRKQVWEYTPVTGTWLRKPDFPGTSAGVGFTVGNLGYVATGTDTNDFWQYDPVADKWTRKTSFPGRPRYGAVGFSLGNKGYIGTGMYYMYEKDFWSYDPVSDSWTEIAALPGVGRQSAYAFTIGDFGYIGSGSYAPGEYTSDLWQYDPSLNKWTSKRSSSASMNAFGFSIGKQGYAGGYHFVSRSIMDHVFGAYAPMSDTWTTSLLNPLTREGATAFTVGQKAFVGTGAGETILEGGTKDFWQFDPISGEWYPVADFSGGVRAHAVAFAAGNKGYVGTGQFKYGLNGSLQFTKDFWEYDPVADQWTRKADFPGEARTNAVAFSAGDLGYVGTGISSLGNKNDFWRYDASADTWTKIKDLPGEGREGSVAFTINNKAYVVMGRTAGGIKTDLWEYDPGSDMWSAKAAFPGVPRTDAAGFSIGGYGYLGTGLSESGIYLYDFWKYDPLQDKWTQELDFSGSARNNAVGFNIGNKGYLATGTAGNTGYSALSDLWEFSYSAQPNLAPIAGAWFQKYYNPTTALLAAWGSRDPEGGRITYSWEKTAGPGGSGLLYGNSASPVVTGLVNGTYSFRLTVTDNQRATGTADLSFTVSINLPPVAGAWLQKYYSPTSVLLAAWDSHDPEGGPITYFWEKTAGPDGSTLLYGNSASPVVNGLVNGTYTYRLTVTDNQGATGWKELTFTVSGAVLSGNRWRNASDEHAVISDGKTLIVYPSPATDILNIKWLHVYTGAATMTITDLTGRKMKVISIRKTAFDYNTTVQLNDLRPGAYYLNISNSQGKMVTTPFMKK